MMLMADADADADGDADVHADVLEVLDVPF